MINSLLGVLCLEPPSTCFNRRSKPEKETYEKHPKTSSDVKWCQVSKQQQQQGSCDSKTPRTATVSRVRFHHLPLIGPVSWGKASKPQTWARFSGNQNNEKRFCTFGIWHQTTSWHHLAIKQLYLLGCHRLSALSCSHPLHRSSLGTMSLCSRQHTRTALQSWPHLKFDAGHNLSQNDAIRIHIYRERDTEWYIHILQYMNSNCHLTMP